MNMYGAQQEGFNDDFTIAQDTKGAYMMRSYHLCAAETAQILSPVPFSNP